MHIESQRICWETDIKCIHASADSTNSCISKEQAVRIACIRNEVGTGMTPEELHRRLGVMLTVQQSSLHLRRVTAWHDVVCIALEENYKYFISYRNATRSSSIHSNGYRKMISFIAWAATAADAVLFPCNNTSCMQNSHSNFCSLKGIRWVVLRCDDKREGVAEENCFLCNSYS